ncbi:hypothetical protein [Leucobacter sp. G161]|uniref:hypothetical protein n=1 Tax=Leucobacter sp. G161 TaxID=663704 RepID=UPI00073C56CB|nr:hypothetical protein [Leucobacter sp. G161]KUF08522.1 hypothetical protein AUL38_04520 [Leucobacter sp. G161]
MANRQTATPEFQTRLEELATLSLACRAAFHEIADRFHWTPAPGSPAEEDALRLPSPDPLLPEPRVETGHRLIADVVQTFLLTSSGHLGGLASLYTSGEVLFSPALLIRSIIENCAHAIWVLGGQGEPAEDRLARCYLEELKSAEEAKKNAGYMYGKLHASHVHSADRYRQLKKQILARFPDTTKQILGEYELHRQKLPKLEDAVKEMYALTEAAGGTITQEQASGIYGFLSNRTHPTLYPARQLREWEGDETSGHAVAHLHVGMGPIEDEARAALAAFYNALSYVTSYYAWPTTLLEALEMKIQATIPGFFR